LKLPDKTVGNGDVDFIAAVSETAAGVALVFGICTRFAALGAAALLAIAAYSLQVVKGFGWT
jgi:putative oxidoreductase